MPNTANWLGSNRLTPVNATIRAAECWKRIQDKPSSVTFYDPTTEAAIAAGAQTVRLEYENQNVPLTENMAGGQSPMRDLTIIGVRDHPSVNDTVVEMNYRFRLNGIDYRVIDVIAVPGEVQASAERLDGS